MMKSLVPWLLSLFLLPLVSCIHTSPTSSDPLSYSTDQTVMLHWLELDDDGIVREAETDGTRLDNRTLSVERPLRHLSKVQPSRFLLGETVNDMAPLLSISTTVGNAHPLFTKTDCAMVHPKNFV